MATKRPQFYIGINNDLNGGMTAIGRIIRDAWVFELLPETETCEGWDLSRIDALNHRVNAEWDKYGCMVGELPPELRERHQRIHAAAIESARQAGWTGDDETRDED